MRTQLDDLRSAEQSEGADIPTLIAERDECRRVPLPTYHPVGCVVVLKAPLEPTGTAVQVLHGQGSCHKRRGSPQAMPQEQLVQCVGHCLVSGDQLWSAFPSHSSNTSCCVPLLCKQLINLQQSLVQGLQAIKLGMTFEGSAAACTC